VKKDNLWLFWGVETSKCIILQNMGNRDHFIRIRLGNLVTIPEGESHEIVLSLDKTIEKRQAKYLEDYLHERDFVNQ